MLREKEFYFEKKPGDNYSSKLDAAKGPQWDRTARRACDGEVVTAHWGRGRLHSSALTCRPGQTGPAGTGERCLQTACSTGRWQRKQTDTAEKVFVLLILECMCKGTSETQQYSIILLQYQIINVVIKP